MGGSASAYSFGWEADAHPTWDDDRARLFATVPGELFPSALRIPGRPLPGRWWRVTDGSRVVALAWLHVLPGRAVALLAVPDSALRTGATGYGTVRLGEEAVAVGLGRVTDVSRLTYPDRTAVSVWVLGRSGARPADGTDRSRG